jgi:hypothetical protein
MKQGLNIFPRLFLLGLIAALSACSSVKDLTNVDLTNMKIWPFGNSADAPRVYLPANSTPYMCEGNKKFFVRMLDKGASVLLICLSVKYCLHKAVVAKCIQTALVN